MAEPPYVSLQRSGELGRRAARALELLGSPCRVCPRLCSVDRLSDERGLCRIGRQAMVASHFPHFGEENCLRGWKGSGTIFFSGCNLRCVFCLPPDAQIATAAGPRAIGDIFEASTHEVALGEGAARKPAGVRVYTRTGELAQVSKTFRRPYRGELIRLRPLNAPALRLTPNHEVFAAHRSDPDRVAKVPAGSLTGDHYLVVPKLTAGTAATSVEVEALLADHVSAPVRAPRRRVDEHALERALAKPRTSREIASDLGYHPAYVRRLRSELRAGSLLSASSAAPRRAQAENGRFRFAGEHRPDGSVGLSERTKWKDAGSHYLVPIHSMEAEPYEGDVYNLEVEHPTHSYVAPAVAVANCQNFDVSWKVQGEEASAERLAGMMLELQAIGCHNINFVTPEHVVPQILEALPLAVDGGLRLPIVYNTSAYDSSDSLELMDGVVDVFMPDLKLASPEATRRYLGKREYAEVAMRNVLEMTRQVGELVLDERGLARRGLIVRHLVMPGLLDETEEVLRFVAEELGPGTYVNLMGQYYPAGKVERYEEINRRPELEELQRAFEIAHELGLRRLDQRSRQAAVGVG